LDRKKNGVWDGGFHALPKNWVQNPGLATDFANGIGILFDDSAASGTVTLSGVVSPRFDDLC
jgi:hypothetical protein